MLVQKNQISAYTPWKFFLHHCIVALPNSRRDPHLAPGKYITQQYWSSGVWTISWGATHQTLLPHIHPQTPVRHHIWIPNLIWSPGCSHYYETEANTRYPWGNPEVYLRRRTFVYCHTSCLDHRFEPGRRQDATSPPLVQPHLTCHHLPTT